MFNEASLEKILIELLGEMGIPHQHGSKIHKPIEAVLLHEDLKAFLLQQYEDITLSELNAIIQRLEALPASTLYESNKLFSKMLADGFSQKREDRHKPDLFIRLLDYTGKHNICKVVNQLEIKGTQKRIPDLIVYINGLPLVVIELKTIMKEHITLKDAYTQLTTRYKRDIPALFKYNAFCVIGDGVNTKMGTLFSPYEFFYAWRKINPEDTPKEGIDSLLTMAKGLFHPERLLEVIQHFIYFPDSDNQKTKIICRYPQYYAATKIFENIKRNMRPHGAGKGGTYFGATGCGKSYTMLFLTRLLMKSTYFSSPTIVIITDRTDLDDQLSEQFSKAKGFIGDENIISVESRDKLREHLQGIKSGGVFLTTIQKFTEDAKLLSDRNNIICISDEAHRTQVNIDQQIKITEKGVKKTYGFAHYLRESLPQATYVGFTGTPIDGTIDVFGAVVDAYTMMESVIDEITVKILYEGRAAKVNLNQAKLAEIEAYYAQCAEEGANDYQIDESKKATTQLDVILGDPKRLKLIAQDFVKHYEKRLHEGASVEGKAVFVCSNRTIAYDLYREIVALRPDWAKVPDLSKDKTLTAEEKKQIKPLERVKMVMTRGKDDKKELYNMLGTKEHRKELDRQFKIAKSNFKIAIVVDMWLTGFDVPFLDTIYIDKPIQQHSLIQTISRVNRVYAGKDMGLVVDYIGIKNNMNIALKKYSSGDTQNFEDIEKAIKKVKDDLDLIHRLFHKFDSTAYFKGKPLEQLQCLNKGAEFVQLTQEQETKFMGLTQRLRTAYQLCCANEAITQKERDEIHFYLAIRSIVHKLTKGDAPDTAQMNDKVREMIKEALMSEGIEEIFKLNTGELGMQTDIFSDEYMSKIEKIALPNTRIKLLQMLLKQAIEDFKKVNKIKGVDFSKRLKELVDFYNERKENTVFADDVLDDVAERFTQLFEELKQERVSFMSLGIDFEEKAFYDILKAVAEKYQFDYPHEKLITLSQEVKKIVDDKAKYTDWANREDIKAELKFDLVRTLHKNGYPPVPKDEVFKEIFEQAENFKKYSEL